MEQHIIDWEDAPPRLHGPIAHHFVPLDGVDLDVRVVHEAVDADAGAEETGKGEANLKGIRRGIRQPVLLRVGASHGGSLVEDENMGRSILIRLYTGWVRGGHHEACMGSGF